MLPRQPDHLPPVGERGRGGGAFDGLALLHHAPFWLLGRLKARVMRRVGRRQAVAETGSLERAGSQRVPLLAPSPPAIPSVSWTHRHQC
jgi:hypothetical protein